MCSALSPDRYPRPARAFVYRGHDTLPAAAVPGEARRAGERAFSRPSPRLTSPPSYHSRTWFLNLVPNVPAPKFGTPPGKTVIAAGIGRPRRLAGGTRRASSEFLLADVLSLGPLPRQSPRPLEGDLEDARERAPWPFVQLQP